MKNPTNDTPIGRLELAVKIAAGLLASGHYTYSLVPEPNYKEELIKHAFEIVDRLDKAVCEETGVMPWE